MTIRSAVLFVLLAILVLAFVAAWIGKRRQQHVLAADIDRLLRAASAHVVTAPADSQVQERLPPPVARYLRLALPSPRHIQEVRMRQTGTLRTDTTSERWMPFDAEHIVVPPATGFLWDARVRIAPLLHVRVRDALIEGRGSGQASVMSAFTISAAAGGIEMDAGSLHRYLAEAVWYPAALLPSPALTWAEMGTNTALATLTTHGVSVSLEFRFADTGEVTGIYTPARWGSFAGGYRQAGWEGHFHNYRDRDGIVVPTEGEVGWYVGGEWRAVWKGVVVAWEMR